MISVTAHLTLKLQNRQLLLNTNTGTGCELEVLGINLRLQSASLPRDAPMGKEDNPAEMVSGVHTAEPAAARASTFNDGLYDHYGKGGLDETVSKTQAQIMVGNYFEDTIVESHVPCEDSVLNLNEDLTNGPKIDKNKLG